MYLLASLAACVSISVDGRTAVRNVWIKLGAQEWGDKNSTGQLNEAIEAHAPDNHPLLANTDIKMVCLAGTRHDRGLLRDCTAFLLEAVTDTLAFLETRTPRFQALRACMDDNDFWADEENEEQVGDGGGLADRAVRGNNESTEDNDKEDEDEDEDGGNKDEGGEKDEGEGDEANNGGYWDVTFHGRVITNYSLP
eukprot:jgi/Tetstr1/420311/TSEL_011432.t1